MKINLQNDQKNNKKMHTQAAAHTQAITRAHGQSHAHRQSHTYIHRHQVNLKIGFPHKLKVKSEINLQNDQKSNKQMRKSMSG